MSGLHVNFTDKEATSEARVFTAVQTGWYLCSVYEIEEAECGPNSKNPGKPFWKLTLSCLQEGDLEGRRFWTNVMLFEGALYSLKQLLQACGYDITPGEFEVPDPDELVGKEVVASIAKVLDTYKMEHEAEDGERFFKNEVKGFKSVDELEGKIKLAGQGAVGGGKGSLLP
jgi:hypothetical protein